MSSRCRKLVGSTRRPSLGGNVPLSIQSSQPDNDFATVENDASWTPVRPSSLETDHNGSGPSPETRNSSETAEQRDYILDLANPERTPSDGAEGRRQQKHPATLQCNLCPKRFTRASNLRFHLRTHTDKLSFVCTVCGKAFTRQDNLKRHTNLHLAASSHDDETLVSQQDHALKPGSRGEGPAMEPSSAVQALLSRWLGDNASAMFTEKQD